MISKCVRCGVDLEVNCKKSIFFEMGKKGLHELSLDVKVCGSCGAYFLEHDMCRKSIEFMGDIIFGS